MSEFETSQLFDIPVARCTMSDAVRLAEQCIVEKRKLHIGVVNAAKVVKMRSDEFLRESVLSSDLILADGASIVLASRVLGEPLPERVAGIDLMHALFESANENRHRVFLLGAHEEVSKKVESWVKRTHPNVVICGRANGYFSDEQEGGIARSISESRPDIVFVAITSPKKEVFMARWGEMLGSSVLHGVGGSFDVVAGKVRRAPKIYQKLGMEWFYRFIQEPRRLGWRYATTNTRFLLMLVGGLTRKIFGIRREGGR